MRPRGLTLVEVIVALALGAALLAAVQRLLVHVCRGTAYLEQRRSRQAQAELPFELLEQDLRSQPAGGGLTLRDGVLTVSTANALHARHTTPRHAVEVEYRSVAGQNGLSGWQRRERELSEKFPEQGVSLVTQLRNVALAVFDGQTWQTQWPLSVPRSAVALRLTLTDKNEVQQQRVLPLAPLAWRRHGD